MTKSAKIILVVLLLGIYCFAFQGSRGLFEPDEGRYSAVALQMINSSDWLTPRTHPQQEHLTKPPLTYWAIAGSILLLGKSEFAVRFPNTIAFLISIIACLYLGRVFTPKRPWIVALIFGAFLFPATMCNGATTDYIVTMWQTLAVCFFALAYWRGKGKLIWFMWAAFGLAFLTKGPPGILPLLSIIVFLQLKCSKNRHLSMHWIRGLLLMTLIGGSWYFFIIFQNNQLVQYFLWDEIVLRLFSGHHQRHTEWYSFLYIYVPVLVFGSLPWSYYVGRGFVRSFQIAKRGIRSKGGEEHSQHIFLMAWFLIPMIIFIISRSNLPLYILPLFIPLAVIAAGEIERCNVSLHKFRYQILVWCALIVLVRPLMASVTFGKDSSQFAKAIKTKYPNPVEEIVFVNTRPALGLQFYTGSDIDHVPLEWIDLVDEFNEKESRLWLVSEHEAELFRDTIAAHHVRMFELGPIEAWNNYVLFQEISDSI